MGIVNTLMASGVGRMVVANGDKILLGAGLGCMTAGTVLLVKNAYKYDVISSENEERLEKLAEAIEAGDISGKEITNEKLNSYIKFGSDIVKEYWLPGALYVGGACMVVGGHRITSKRLGAMTGAYTIAQATLNKYRQRVMEDQGRDKDIEYLTGGKVKTIKCKDENGEKIEKKQLEFAEEADVALVNSYARYFCQKDYFDNEPIAKAGSRLWTPDKFHNEFMITSTENYFNDLLRARTTQYCPGYVTLNEVYDKLGFDRTDYGAFVGWVDRGDNYIDFGTMEIKAYEDVDVPCMLLDFNVEGHIQGLLKTNPTVSRQITS